MMDAAQMHALACAYALSPSEESLHAAIAEIMPLCALIARRFSGRGAEYEDLFQVASLACVAALKGFDPHRGLKFTTYVTPTITGAVRNYLRDKTGLLHTPRAIREQSIQLHAAREAYLRAHREEPTPRDLAQALGWDLAKVLSVLAAQQAGRVASLDERDEGGLSPADRLPFEESGFERAEQRQDLRRALAKLSDRERALLSLRFQNRLSQRETAERMNMTQIQVSRMERRALAALRKEMDAPP